MNCKETDQSHYLTQILEGKSDTSKRYPSKERVRLASILPKNLAYRKANCFHISETGLAAVLPYRTTAELNEICVDLDS